MPDSFLSRVKHLAELCEKTKPEPHESISQATFDAMFGRAARNIMPDLLAKLEQQRKALETFGRRMDDGSRCFCGGTRPVDEDGALGHFPRCLQVRAALTDSVEEPKT